MPKARVFKWGSGQAVRLPKEFRLTSAEVEIFRRGDEIVLREKPRTMLRAFELIAELPETILDARDERPPQERRGL